MLRGEMLLRFLRTRILAALPVLLLAVGGVAQELQPGRGTAKSPEPATQKSTEVLQGTRPIFEFHSGFWINLHHFLYQQARLRRPSPQATPKTDRPGQTEVRPDRIGARGRSAGAAPISTEGLTREEQQAWAAALDYYAGNLSDRDLLFNGDMVNIKNRLEEVESCADLSGQSFSECFSGLQPGLISVLERAAPLYRARWWPEHDRSNRAWIASVGPMVRQLGGELAQQLSVIYRAEWPSERLRVDVVFYGGPFGAYTSLDPLRMTISSSDARNQDPAALEVLFHEASHALARAVRDAIVRECRARSKPIPRDLWHALLFYTTGEIVKRALNARNTAVARAPQPQPTDPHASPSRGPGDYTPYAYRYGLYARGWNHYQRVLERHWQSYLDGKVEFDTALARLVSAL